ncbi:MAG: glycosyltransferase family A protein [Bacteroidota bacterium]|nr:glycosyltransferase family A protein [Bacteroidota bacterium]
MIPIISIVIPCYNHGHFIKEALESISVPDNILFEVIIVDDGSKDPNTIQVLEQLKKEGYQVVRQENKGLSGARNTAINLANGKYILPLDCDNKILPNYIPYAVNFLENNPDYAVVYGNGELFGDRTGPKPTKEFTLHDLIIGNFIDACAVFRKDAWAAIGGYDESKMMRLGVEDWEFWLHLAFKGFKFHHYNEKSYLYRLSGTSMVDKDTSPNFNLLKNYIEKKHSYYINYNAPGEYIAAKFKANPPVFLFKLILLTYFPKKYKELVERLKIKRI